MQIIKTAKEMKAFSRKARNFDKTIGFVPTMGCLHEGHLSLIEAARQKNDVVIVSIFVNPAQFGPLEDFKKYPRELAQDKKKLKDLKIDVLFCPEEKELYPPGFETEVKVKELSRFLCGESRPGHFEGVTTIVAKLFNIVSPHQAFFGQKDFQQLVVIKRMTADLDMDIEIIALPIVREFDGLAMSSRNRYLTAEQRRVAPALYRTLTFAKTEILRGAKDLPRLERVLREMLAAEPLIKIDYLGVADPLTLRPVEKPQKKVLVAIAAYLGQTRLLDNILVER